MSDALPEPQADPRDDCWNITISGRGDLVRLATFLEAMAERTAEVGPGETRVTSATAGQGWAFEATLTHDPVS